MKSKLLLGSCCLFAAVVGLALSSLSNHATVVYYFARSRTGACSLPESLASVAITRAQIEGMERLRAASRIIRRGAEGLDLHETPRGTYWSPRGSESALYSQLAEQERNIYRALQPGDVVLDCGANIGLFGREAVRSGASLVVAIEPSPENLECLRRNLAEEIKQKKVIVYPKGVWDKEDVLTLNIDPDNTAANSFVRKTSHKEISVARIPLTTVDKLVTELGLSRLDLIKMDIEGAEQKAITGATNTLRKFRPRLALCVYHLPDDAVEVPVLVRRAVADYRTESACLLVKDAVVPQIVHFY